MRGRNHLSAASPSGASSQRGRATRTSRITDRSSVSPARGVEPNQAVFGPRRYSRVSMVSSPTEGGVPIDRGAATTPGDAAHEAEESRSLTLEDTKPGAFGAGQSGAGSHAAGGSLSTEHTSAANMAVGLPAYDKGEIFDMLSSNVSFSDSEEGSSSEVEVCDFLEESGSLAASGGLMSGSGGDGCGQYGGGGAVGEMAKRFLNSESDDCDSSGGENPGGLHNMGMDQRDIAFLAESRELREAMLGVEDLHFGEAKQLLLVGAYIHGLLFRQTGGSVSR